MASERIKGIAAARAAFKALPTVIRERTNDAVEATTIRVLAGAKRRLAPHRRYGFLEHYLDRSMNRQNGHGKVGLPRRAAVIPGGAALGARRTQVIRRLGKDKFSGKWKPITTFDVYGTGSAQGARVVYPSKYGHLVEFGHRRGRGHSAAPPSPFMIPAAEAEKQSFVSACMASGPHIERDMSVSRFR